MAILKVAQLGNPVLRSRASEVSAEVIRSAEFQRLVDDMVETMREYDGVGIAAPQVHVSKRVFAMEVASNVRYPGKPEFPLTVIVNPRITVVDAAAAGGWEGCLSIPGLRGFVRRARAVQVEGLDRFGDEIVLSVEDFPARIVQHETDHLDGVVYLDRMHDLSGLTFQREYERFHLKSSPDDQIDNV